MKHTLTLEFATEEDLQAFLSWKTRTPEEGTCGPGELVNHLMSPGCLPPALWALWRAKMEDKPV